MAPTAFVTGASRGIGKASALALADAGFDIAVTARTVTEGERHDYSATVAGSRPSALPGSITRTADEVRARGREALPLRLDLTDIDSVDLAVDAAFAHWGGVDLLLNNGIYQGPGLMDRFLDVPLDAARRIFEGNVFAQIHVTQRVVRNMLERGGGTVINMTSGSALMDPPAPTGEGGWGYAYAASKGAFHRMVGILHVELAGRGIRAFNVNPGYVRTESQKASLGADDPLNEHFRGNPPEVPAAVVAWLASDPAASELAGETIDAQRLCRKRGLLPGWPPTDP